MDITKISHSGDLDLIARLSETTIVEYFGEESPEYYAWQQKEADKLVASGKLKLPRIMFFSCRTFDPTRTKSDLDAWIRETHKKSGWNLPTGYKRKNLGQLRGMYHGMLRSHNRKPEDVYMPS